MSNELKQVEVKVIGSKGIGSIYTLSHYGLLVEEGSEDAVHTAISKENPDNWVNFVWENGSFIAGVPYNMTRDERLMDAGLLTWDEYKAKWYPGV